MSGPDLNLADGSQPEKPKGLLYHYTDKRGILGIIESRSVWATHVRYLNDSSEFALGWRKSWEKLQHLIEQRDLPNKLSLLNVFTRLRKVISDSSDSTNYYLWCLTDDESTSVQHQGFNGDRLSQWRAYSGDGPGFSLGFDADALQECFSTPMNVVFNLRRCIYEEKLQDLGFEKIAADHLEDFLRKWSVYANELRDPALDPAENVKKHGAFLFEPLGKMYLDFIDLGSFIKHPGFIEENEWRFAFISENESDCSFRESRFGLTPFLPIDLDLRRSPSPLKRIVVGPDTRKDEWVRTIKLVLAKAGISGVEVVPSQIPYR